VPVCAVSCVDQGGATGIWKLWEKIGCLRETAIWMRWV